MAGLFDALGISGTALSAQQHGVQVTSNNISNVSTPGYRREELLLSSAGPATRGVIDEGARRVIDVLLGRRITTQQGMSAFAQTRADVMTDIEGLVGTLGALGLGGALDGYFGAWRELASAPQDLAARTTALAQTEALALRIRNAAGDLSAAQTSTDAQLVRHVEEANALIDRVAALNGAIVAAEASGSEASGLRDQRDVAIQGLGERLGATSIEDASGRVAVLVAGVAVVQGDAARHLAAEPDATTGLSHVLVDGGSRVDLTGRIESGRVGALLVLRDQDIAGWMTALDAFAYDFATAANGAHTSGVGLDGVGGRNLFTPPAVVAGAAAALTVDASIAGTPDHLGAALVAGAPGDGRGADAMAQLDQALVANGGQATLSQALVGTLTNMGQAVQRASDDFTTQAERLSQLETLRESQSGVSIEEQMLMLDRYQRAFQAASKVISVVNQMLEDLLSLGGSR